jgi:hypothetical protein
VSDDSAKVVSMIERAIRKDPGLKSTELQVRAAKIDASIADLTGRQFHARFVIQVRKRLFASTPKKRAQRKPKAGARADSAVSFLSAAYEQKKLELDAAIDQAFQRAITADSARQIGKLLASIEQQTREFEHV